MDDIENPRKKRVYRPMLANVDSFGKDLSEGEFNDLWGIFDTLSEETKDILMAPEMSKKIELLQKERGLSDETIEIVSAIIREYFLGKKDVPWLQNALIAKFDQKDVAFVKEYIQKNILTIKPVPKVPAEDSGSPTVQTIQLPILDALAKYQRLSEQTVTEDRIAVKGESAPVRGSIRNWLRHYRDVVGIRKHSTMERGQFLFQGENTRRLSAPERERVSFLLKALDENTPVPLDVERQEVIFPVFEDRGSAATSAASSVVPALETSFRPLEKFPAQAAPIRKALEWSGSERDMSVSSVPERERPRAVGVSAPVYAPAAAVPAMEAPFAQKGSMSFSSSHVLPHEKAQEEKLQKDASSHPSEGRREPEAISVIRPRGNQFGFQEEARQEAGASAESGSAASPVVNLRSSGGRHARGKV